MQYSIRLITTWSGPLPRYLPLFFGTAARNPTIEFIFVADSSQPYPLPPNVRWVEMSFPEILSHMGERLGCDLSHATPFKMCDLKPAFGVAFADLLAGCDFWGHLDCDIVLGDLRSFIPAERLAEFDVLSFKGHRFVHGPLTLWRNNEEINRMYQCAPWQDIFEADQYLGFDETGKRWKWSARKPTSIEERIARGEVPCITDVVYGSEAKGFLRIYDGEHIVETKPRAEISTLALRWEQGRLFEEFSKRPLAFFHIHWAKSDAERGDPEYIIPSWHWNELPDQFGITRKKIGSIDFSYRLAHFKLVSHSIRMQMIKKSRHTVSALRRRVSWWLKAPADWVR